VRLARITVPLNGLALPDNLKPIDDIGAKHFGMATALRAVQRAASVVPNFEDRDRILTGVTTVQIADFQTYFLYGVATTLVALEGSPRTAQSGKKAT
jgi:hypothetical protein